jgi:hypothetical protein
MNPMQSPNTGVGRKLCPTPEREGLGSPSCSLLEWADENLLKAECITSEIADTGDYVSMWHVEDCDGRKSYGQTLTEAIQDAMKGDDDPTRYDYVPPELPTDSDS